MSRLSGLWAAASSDWYSCDRVGDKPLQAALPPAPLPRETQECQLCFKVLRNHNLAKLEYCQYSPLKISVGFGEI